jgi:hypothetical protein
MIDQKGPFSGDLENLDDIDVDAPIANARQPCCEYFRDEFMSAANKSEEAGDSRTASVYRFLNTLVGFHASFDTPARPFTAWIQIDGRRSPMPSDLAELDISAIQQLAPRCKHPALRSRLFDLLWELRRDHNACAEAVEAYVVAADRLNTSQGSIHAAPYYHRALQLAGSLGRSKELFQRVAQAVQQVARDAATDVSELRCLKYLRIIHSHSSGNALEFAQIAEDLAKALSRLGDFYKARAYWEVAADLRRASGDPQAERAARLAVGETYIDEADKRSSGSAGSAMAAASLLISGIECLRRAGEAPERIANLRVKLRELQEGSLEEMQRFSTEVDISEAVRSARDHVKRDTLPEALFASALGHGLTDLKDLRERVLQAMRDFPMTHLLGMAMIDSMGRVIRQRPSLFGLGGEELEKGIEEEMFSHAARLSWGLRVSGYINPGRLQILNDHHPSFEDLIRLVVDNPFVPAGHEGIFLRGLHAGFYGDFLIASHLLIPQIENSLRYILESSGTDVSNLMSDGTQPVKILGTLLSMEMTKKILGEELCFELRGCLIEKAAFDFRNRVAHGFVSEA